MDGIRDRFCCHLHLALYINDRNLHFGTRCYFVNSMACNPREPLAKRFTREVRERSDNFSMRDRCGRVAPRVELSQQLDGSILEVSSLGIQFVPVIPVVSVVHPYWRVSESGACGLCLRDVGSAMIQSRARVYVIVIRSEARADDADAPIAATAASATEVHDRPASPKLVVCAAVVYIREAELRQCRGAHDARLARHIELHCTPVDSLVNGRGTRGPLLRGAMPLNDIIHSYQFGVPRRLRILFYFIWFFV